MKISFVRTATEALASMRYRILIPMEALIELGHEVDIVDSLPSNTDVLIFSKHFHKERDYAMAVAAKERGIKVIYDICDNHFGTQHSEYYRQMVELANIITCNTPVMQQVVHDETGRATKLVNDPYEYTQKKPVFKFDGDRVKVLWYGHSTNLNTVPLLLNELGQLKRKSHLIILSNSSIHLRENIDKVKVEGYVWSSVAMNRYLEWADIVAIPTILSDDTKKTKSHNRVTEAIMSGKMVVAHPLPSYERYRPFVWIGESLGDGIEWAMRNPKRNLELIEAGQQFIKATLSPEKIANAWEAAING